MKKNKMFLAALSLMIIASINFSCEVLTDDSAAQGPRNPSFETDSDWNLINDLRRATAVMRDGTSFMPTNGLRYLSLDGNTAASSTVSSSAYQDNVDLSKSTTIIFDYLYSSIYGTITLEILFTSNGTETLWSRTFSNYGVTLLSDQKKGEIINLPSLPEPGRLTIKATATSTSAVVTAQYVFAIDEIRVQ